MKQFKFYTLRVTHLKLENLSGLCTETNDVAKPILTQLMQPLLLAKLGVMATDLATLQSLMNRTHGSPLTPQLKVLDKHITSFHIAR